MSRKKFLLTIMIGMVCSSQQMLGVPMQPPRYDAKKDAFISTFFIKAQEQIPELEQVIKEFESVDL